MSEKLFVYGTLHPDSAPRVLSDVVGRMRLIDTASVLGTLYDLGAYPGLVLSPAGRHVFGSVFELPTDDNALLRMDAYEGVDLTFPERSLFCRVQCTTMLADGSAIDVWVYVYNRAVDGRPAIESGRWVDQKRRAMQL